jgi:osmotically-inducible protein OsmY
MARISTAMTLLAGAAAGAAAQYFLDSGAGGLRRNSARDRLLSRARHGASDAATMAGRAAQQAKGKVATMRPTPSDDRKHEQLGDAGLAAKVASEIFRASDAPKGQVDVNAENGVVFLRGEVDREWIERLEREAGSVNGVKAVRNLMHAPGTPAPTTAG